MKLIEATRSTTPCSSTQLLVLEELALAALEEAADSASIVFQFRCFRRGVSPTSGSITLRERRLQRVALVARVPDEREPAARLQHAMDLAQRPSASNQWNAGATVTRVHPARRRAGSARRCRRARRRPARAARARRASRAAARPRRRSRRSGRAGASACPVPAARSSTVRPGRSSSLSTMRAIAASGIVRPSALVHVGRREAARCGMELRHGARSRRWYSSESARCPCPTRFRTSSSALSRSSGAAAETALTDDTRSTAVPASISSTMRGRRAPREPRTAATRRHVLDLPVVPVRARPQRVDDGVDRLHQRVIVVVRRSRSPRSPLPGRSTRCISANAASLSNQWNA